MPSQFEYSGVDKAGQPVRGRDEGASPLDLVLRLRASGIRVYSLRKELPLSQTFRSSRQVNLSELALFNEQLAGLLQTRLPLGESLHHLSAEMKNPRIKQVMEDICRQLDKGNSFSECLAKHRDHIPSIYINIVRAGEKSGNLTEALYLATAYFRATERVKKKLLNIVLYPLILTFFSILILIFLIKVMAPPYIEMYSGFNVEYPFILSMIAQADRLLNPASAIFAAIALIAIAVIVFPKLRDEKNKEKIDRFLLRVPVWGQMMKEGLLGHNISTVAILLKSGVPLSESLNLVKDLSSNSVLRDLFASAAEDVSEGKTLSENLVRQPLAPLEIAWIIRNGEMNGNLISSLDNAASMCQSKFEASEQMILSVLEPLLLFAVGSVVVAVAIALFYPLYTLSKYLEM